MDKAVIGKVFIIFITFLTSCVGSVYDGVSPYPYSPVGDYPALILSVFLTLIKYIKMVVTIFRLYNSII